MTQARIYLIGSPDARPVKIGTSQRPTARLAACQAGSPVPLTLLWETPGDRFLEELLHEHFAPFRIHGEWFDFGDQDPVPLVKDAAERFAPAAGLLAARLANLRSTRAKAPEKPGPRRVVDPEALKKLAAGAYAEIQEATGGVPSLRAFRARMRDEMRARNLRGSTALVDGLYRHEKSLRAKAQ